MFSRFHKALRSRRLGWLFALMLTLLPMVAASAHADDSIAGSQIAGPGNNIDPLKIYYGNTVVCGLTHAGNDLCHVWFYPNGKLVIFDQGGLHPAHYKVFSYRKTGAISVCMYWNDDHTTQPTDLIDQGQPSRGKPKGFMAKMPGKDPGRYCVNDPSGRTVCKGVADVSALTPDEQKLAHDSMGQRWQGGMCYPYREDIKPGAVYLEWDDPAPSQDGGDKVWFLAGHH